MSAPSGSGGASDDPLTVELAVHTPAQVTASLSPVEPEPGTVLGSRYLLEEIIGRGGTSSVYRARDLHRDLRVAPSRAPPVAPSADTTGNLVAVKLLHDPQRSEPLARARLQREFHTMKRLSNIRIARVFELGCDEDLWFMSMQLIAGQTLKAWMTRGGTYAEALGIIDTCCEALEYAHSRGIVHGDLKPTNVLVSADGTAKLIDFGSSSISGMRAGHGSASTIAATPLYASPQVLAGQHAEPLDDVFSLACLSYSILSGGRHPYGGHPSFEDLRAKSAPTYVRAIPVELFEVIARGLSSDAERRPPSVSEFRRELVAAEQRRCAKAAASPIVVQTSSPKPSRVESVLAAITPTIARLGKKLGHRGRSARVKPSVASLVVLVTGVTGAALLFARTEWVPSGGVEAPHHHHPRAMALKAPAAPLVARAAAALAPAPPAAALSAPAPPAAAPIAAAAAPSVRPTPLPHDASSISFEAALVHASAQQSLVAITVRRAPASKNPGAFVWRVERGSAVPAIDYKRIEPRRARFIEGQTVRTLFIPLLDNSRSQEPHGPRFFDVVLQPVAGGPALGRLARLTVVIDPTPTIWVANFRTGE